jgi:hypothetical protein
MPTSQTGTAVGTFDFFHTGTIAVNADITPTGGPFATSINFEDRILGRDDLKVIGTLDVTCSYADSTMSGPDRCAFTLPLTGKPLITWHVVAPANGRTVTDTFTTAGNRNGLEPGLTHSCHEDGD